jgi:hypothetical protein
LADIPERIERFVYRNVHSVHELEILLLMNDGAGKEWVTHEISERLQIDHGVVEAVIKSLETNKLVVCRDMSGERLYRIDSGNTPTLATLEELSKWYATHRVRILTMIYGKPLNNIQTFADTFRFRENDEE